MNSDNIIEYNLDIIRLVKIYLSYKWFILSVFLIAIAIAFFYNKTAVREYSATVSFYLPTEVSEGSVNSYMRLLPTQSSGIDQLFEDLVFSRRLLVMVSTDLNLKKWYHTPTNDGLTGVLKGHLEFSKKNAIYLLTFSSPYPILCQQVPLKVLEAVDVLNMELELTPKRQLTRIIDPPQIPSSPYKPNTRFTYVVACVFAAIISLLFPLVYIYIKKLLTVFRANAKIHHNKR